MIHPAKRERLVLLKIPRCDKTGWVKASELGQFIGAVLWSLHSWNEKIRVGIVGTKLHFTA